MAVMMRETFIHLRSRKRNSSSECSTSTRITRAENFPLETRSISIRINFHMTFMALSRKWTFLVASDLQSRGKNWDTTRTRREEVSSDAENGFSLFAATLRTRDSLFQSWRARPKQAHSRTIASDWFIHFRDLSRHRSLAFKCACHYTIEFALPSFFFRGRSSRVFRFAQLARAMFVFVSYGATSDVFIDGILWVNLSRAIRAFFFVALLMALPFVPFHSSCA